MNDKNGKSAKSFSTIKEFSLATQKENIEQLVEELKNNTGETNSAKAWEKSLPDLAELLSDPVGYVDKTIIEMEWLIDAAKAFSDDRFSDEKFRRIFDSEMIKKWEDVKKDFEEKVAIGDMEEFLKNKLKPWREETDKRVKAGKPLFPEDLNIDIEYMFDSQHTEKNKKSADVILRYKDRAIVVELKQWTESEIEWKDGFVRVKYTTKDGEQRLSDPLFHPLIQASYYALLLNCSNDTSKQINYTWNHFRDNKENSATLYAVTKHILENTAGNLSSGKEPLKVAPLVYLHNQYYDKGILFRPENVPREIRDFYYKYSSEQKGQFGGGLYTRHKCNNMIDTISNFFAIDDSGEFIYTFKPTADLKRYAKRELKRMDKLFT